MALIRCPECAREASDKAKSCPNCGYPLATPTATQTVKCHDCAKEFPLEQEVCPACGLFNAQKYQNAEPASEGASHAPTAPIFTKQPEWKTAKKGKGRGFLCLIAATLFVSLLLILPSFCDKPANIKVARQKTAEERKTALLARFDDLVAQGQMGNAYRLAMNSPEVQEPEVQARIAKIATKAKAQIAAQEADERKKREATLLAQAKTLPARDLEKNRDV
jgi:primosomal protein N'